MIWRALNDSADDVFIRRLVLEIATVGCAVDPVTSVASGVLKTAESKLVTAELIPSPMEHPTVSAW